MTRLLARLRAFWHRREIRETLDEEIRFHVDMESAAHRARGLTAVQAARQAAIDLGGPGHARDAVLDVRTSPLRRLANSCGQDVRYGLRTFARTPLAIASVVLVLAVGIGLNSAVFGAIDAVFFRPLPVPRPDEMVYVTAPTGAVNFVVFRDRARGSITGMSTTEPAQNVTLSSDSLHMTANGESVGIDYFRVLQLVPSVGRFFEPADDDSNEADSALVISDDVWRHRLGADSNVIGQSVLVDGVRHVIVGIAPPGFRGLSLPWMPSEFWVVRRIPAEFKARVKSVSGALLARLSPGASVRSLGAIVANRPGQDPRQSDQTDYAVRVAAGLLTPGMQGSALGFVRALADAVAVMALAVMLIAAANVVGILMARGVARSAELAVRQALGAGAGRLTQQLLTESALIGAAAGGVGLFVAWVLMHLYHAWSPSEIALDVTANARVLIYTLVVCVGAGLLVGIAPARQALRVNILAGLGAPGAGTTAVTRRRTRYGSVIPQMALSIGLLIVAGAHAQALMNIERRNPGYAMSDIVTVMVRPPAIHVNFKDASERAKADALDREYLARVLDSVRTLPGVSAVALSSATPSAAAGFPKLRWFSHNSLEHRASAAATASGLGASAEFFETFGIPLLAGRPFDDKRDSPTAPLVAIVSAAFAKQLAPDGSIIGQRIAVDMPGRTESQWEWRDVVGVVGDIFEGADVVPMVYLPGSQGKFAWAGGTVAARVSVDPASIAPVIAHTITKLDDRAQLGEAVTMTELVARDHYVRRLTLAMLAIAGIFGVALAAIGLYSAVSYWVAQQARDLGVRATLGATRGDLVRLVLRDGLTTVLIALIPGIALGLVGFRLTAGLVRFVVGPIAAPAFGVIASVVAMVMLVALAACYLPGHRAAKADPLVALRQA